MGNQDTSDRQLKVDDLTWREQDILLLLAERLTNREIAERLHLAESTVKDYVGRIIAKLYVKNRREVVEKARTLGLLEKEGKRDEKSLVNLPAGPTAFVGRRKELAEIKLLLGEVRLLTLTGPGGIGKTRLAVKAARQMVGDYNDGIYFVSFAPIRSSRLIFQTVAEAINFPLATQDEPERQLLRFLKRKQILLVMDNFEHLLEGAGIINDILQAAPDVKILVTSREKLNLMSETNLVVTGMGVPDYKASPDGLQDDAVALFIQSAGKVCPGYEPGPDELEQIRHVCQLVGGMPLALELAASWLQILSIAEIIGETEKGIDFLEAETRDVPARHKSIRSVFDYSWKLISPLEQDILKKLSIFRGGFTRGAAQAVTGATLMQITGLASKSFISHDMDTGRLEIHELLRQYCQEKLADEPDGGAAAMAAHAGFYAEFVHGRGQQLSGSNQRSALNAITADIENVRSAWFYYLDRENVSQLWKMVNGIWQVYWIRGWNHAGMQLFETTTRRLEKDKDDETVALKALVSSHKAYFMAWLGLAEEGFQLALKSSLVLEALDYPRALGYCLVCLNLCGYLLNRIDEEKAAIKKLIKIATSLGDTWLLALANYGFSLVSLIRKEFTEAERYGKISLDISQQNGDIINASFAYIALGHAAFAQKDFPRAENDFKTCLSIAEDFSFHWAIANAYKYLAKVAVETGRIEQAHEYLFDSLRITSEIGYTRDLINLLYDYGQLIIDDGELETAVEILALVVQHPASDQYRWLEGNIKDSAAELLSGLEEQLEPEEFSSAVARGQKRELDEAVAGIISTV